MNYVELVNRFWAFNEEVSFSVTDIALYFYLVKVNNACSWKEMFRRNNYKIMADLSIRSPKTLAQSRNRLKQAGLIDFQTKNGSAEVTYSLTSVKNTEVDAEVRGEVTSRLGRGSYRVKINRNINKNTFPPLSPVPGEAEFSENNTPKPEASLPDSDPAPPESPPRLRGTPPRKTKRFTPPTLQQVEEYCRERGNRVQPEKFINHYTSNGWKVGKNPMKDWRAAIRTWENNDFDNANQTTTTNSVSADGASANERRYGSTAGAKQSIASRIERLSRQTSANVPDGGQPDSGDVSQLPVTMEEKP